MNADWMAFYRNTDSTTKSNAELFRSSSTRLVELLNEGYRYWLHGLTATLGDTAKAFDELSKCRSSTEFAEVQRSWVEATAARRLEEMRKVMDIANSMLGELSASVAKAQAQDSAALVPAAKAESQPAPVPAAPVPAAPVPAAPAKLASAKPAAAKPAAPKAAKPAAAKATKRAPAKAEAAPAPAAPAVPKTE